MDLHQIKDLLRRRKRLARRLARPTGPLFPDDPEIEAIAQAVDEQGREAIRREIAGIEKEIFERTGQVPPPL